jgi:hypothetical protein
MRVAVGVAVVWLCHTMVARADGEAMSGDNPSSESVAARSSSSMRVIPKKENYRVGDPVVLQVEVQNTGNSAVSVNRDHPLLDYDIVVLGPDGKNIPLSVDAERVKKKQQLVSRRIKRSLAPAQRTHEDLEITRYFEMRLPGVYEIRISRHLLPVEQGTNSRPAATVSLTLQER